MEPADYIDDLNDSGIPERLDRWATEAIARYKAYCRGEINSVDGDQVMAGLRILLSKEQS